MHVVSQAHNISMKNSKVLAFQYDLSYEYYNYMAIKIISNNPFHNSKNIKQKGSWRDAYKILQDYDRVYITVWFGMLRT